MKFMLSLSGSFNRYSHLGTCFSVVIYDLYETYITGVKVSWTAQVCRSGAWKFKPGAFLLQNYWISQPESTFLGLAS